MSNWYAGAYWSPRSEPLDNYVATLVNVMTVLADIHPALRRWRDLGRTARASRSNSLVTEDYSDIVGRLLAGQLRDADGDPVLDAGCTVSWWNGAPTQDEAAKLTASFGGTVAGVPNRVVLNLPHPVAAPDLYRPATARRLVETLVMACAPDWATWSSHDLRARQAEPDRPTGDGGFVAGEVIGIPAGWATYLAEPADDARDAPRFERRTLPASATVESLTGGTLVLVGDDPRDPPIAGVAAVRAAMGHPVKSPEPEQDRATAAVAETAPVLGDVPRARSRRRAAPAASKRRAADGDPPPPVGRPAEG
jgi:hypothetical protein